MSTCDALDRYRPVPFYFLTTTDPGAYTPGAVLAAMEDCRKAGYGGIVLFNKPPQGFDQRGYLSEAWFDLTKNFIDAARRLGMQLWINDGFDYPPGDAAGRIAQAAPHLKQLRLRPNREGELRIAEVPWGFPAFEEPESSELFIRFVYEEYYKRFASFFGDGITGFFSDADNRRVNASTVAQCGERYYPWSRRFPELFRERFGFDITAHLAELFGGSSPEISEKYWDLCGELYRQWFANNHRWCAAHNVLYTFHTSDTGPFGYGKCVRSSAFSEGDPLALLDCADLPGTDHELLVLDGGTHYDKRLFSPRVSFGAPPEQLPHPAFADTTFDVRAKYASSAAYLAGKERVMCEMFAATNWGATFADLRRIAAWQIMQGVNFIVPHAVHHRLRGEVKHFAPPEFLRSGLRFGLRQFNDTLARYCRAASAGKYLARYAVVDPTRKAWRGEDTTPFFTFCDRLARRAEGYVVVPENYSGNIECVIDPLKGLPELPGPGIRFTGGELAFMRRELDGEEYLLAANVWSSRTLSGTLVFKERTVELVLEPGEIAVIGGPFESFRSPEKRRVKERFTGSVAVTWEEPQLVPFEKTLSFAATEEMPLSLFVPAENGGEVRVNGVLCGPGRETRICDDLYLETIFTARKGENEVVLATPALFTTPAFIGGAVDVEVQTRGDYARSVFQQYMLSFFEPEEKKITLSPRRSRMTVGEPWEKQGQPFCSGSAVLHFGKVVSASGDRLELPGFAGIAEVIVDGKALAHRALPPFAFDLPAGKYDLSLRLWCSCANRMERYPASVGRNVGFEITAPCPEE